MKCLLRPKAFGQNLGELSKGFYGLYASKGQSPIAPEGWLRALLLQALCGKGSEPLLMEDLDVRCTLRVSQDLRCLAIIHKPSAFFDPMFHCWIDLVIAAGAHARSTDSMQLACASRLLREIRP